MCLGTCRGSVIFFQLRSNNSLTIYTRFTFHKAEIVEVGVLTNETDKKFFVSLCKDNYFKLTSFEK